MEKVFYVSKLVGATEFVLNNYETCMEWVPYGTDEDWRYETTDRDEAQQLCDRHAEWDGSVEYYERVAR